MIKGLIVCSLSLSLCCHDRAVSLISLCLLCRYCSKIYEMHVIIAGSNLFCFILFSPYGYPKNVS
ncbi:hypothetical protein CIPAW_03G034200 [Carya illinoinensis]|uniref:Uncharacterized protein n=1 Tax=Carya illinoinensis TaxID=32201 RepID=A0A8T1QYW2_CARIL|nr:hypothetical protein CIPAW_03G034200 [Carya illinoinensis]KAG6659430.1 hypothetical protein CIPAW_03G034200 [Carya illinoinensis]